MFGDMVSPCGPASAAGVPTVAEGQNASSPLALGTASDHGFAGVDQPGIEMLDAARAFAAWCNDQGGIRGLPIEIVDLDAAVVNVPLVMERTCAQVFAMVGGGWTFDDQMYPRFHECGMISVPAFTATAAATMANGKVQPIPNPIDREAGVWLKWIARTYSDAVDDVAIVHADLSTTNMVADRLASAMGMVGDFGDPTLVEFDPSAPPAWSDVVSRLRKAKARAIAFIGDPEHLVGLLRAMDTASFDVDVVFGDTNLMSDAVTTASSAPASATSSFAKLRIRALHAPFDEAASFTGIASYLDMMNAQDPPGRLGSLGVHTVSSLLLFVTAANSCLDANDNVLERECLLAEAKKLTAWNAGGLHTPTEPSTNQPPSCITVIGLEGSRWTRVFPMLESSDDDGNGYSCDDEIVTIDGDFGDASAGVDSSRLN